MITLKRFYCLLIPMYINISVSSGQDSKGDKSFARYSECGGNMIENRAIVTSPNYPRTAEEIKNVYPPNMDCKWQKSTAFDKNLYRVKFYDMGLQNSPATDGSNTTVCYDYVNITIASIGTLQYCRWKFPTELLSGLGPDLTIDFHSDATGNYRGFMLVYQCVPNYVPCVPNPCVNGECRVFENGIDYNCACWEGYKGPLCDKDINECESEPCLNGGTCKELNGSFSCLCPDGWEGVLCETEVIIVDPCESNPCAKTSTCQSDGEEFKCICADGFTGTLCEEEINECLSDPCSNDGDCVDHINAFECSCKTGWTGPLCNQSLDPCYHKPCETFQVCTAVNDKEYSCTCPVGYGGLFCGEDTNECESEPCKNGGVCNDSINWYECHCKHGYTGPTCEIAPTKCTNPGIPYVGNDTKWRSGSTLQFYCTEGYRLQGKVNLTCQNNSEWTSDMPVCVADGRNNTVLFLPTPLTNELIFLISLASCLFMVLISFVTWIFLKGPWNIGMEVTKVVKLSRVSLTSY